MGGTRLTASMGRPARCSLETGGELPSLFGLDVDSPGPDIAQRAKGDILFPRDSIVYLTCLHEPHALGAEHTQDFRDIMYYFGYGGDVVEYRPLSRTTPLQEGYRRGFRVVEQRCELHQGVISRKLIIPRIVFVATIFLSRNWEHNQNAWVSCSDGATLQSSGGLLTGQNSGAGCTNSTPTCVKPPRGWNEIDNPRLLVVPGRTIQ